jgi:hypothetical protein
MLGFDGDAFAGSAQKTVIATVTETDIVEKPATLREQRLFI